MMILDTRLQEREAAGHPIRVGLVGAGYAGRAVALQLLSDVPGMRLAAIANRTKSFAVQAFTESGISDVTDVSTASDLARAIREQKHVITTDPTLLTRSDDIDVIVEATGTTEFAAKVILDAIQNKKHVVAVSAELDTTLGPILSQYALKQGVIYTQSDGDQPGALVHLGREISLLGFTPVIYGNIKSLIDHYRTPQTQEKFAREHFQRPKMVTSFADGTKIAFEMASCANATGSTVAVRGMYGSRASRVEEAVTVFPKNLYENGPYVDYILGAEPSFGVFIVAKAVNPTFQRYLQVYKMGNGPLYLFYRHCHLGPLETVRSIGQVVECQDAVMKPKGMMCDVVTIAKTDLRKGEVLDGIGGFHTYGDIDTIHAFRSGNLLPMGLSEGCTIVRDIPKDTPITYADVTVPDIRICDRLRAEQDGMKG